MTKEEFKTNWLKALRSGRYKQTTNQLWDGTDGYCCIGVACRVVNATDEQISECNQDIPISSTSWRPKQNAFNLFRQFTFKRSEIINVEQEVTKDWRILSNMNDNGSTFTEIADYIEENF